MVLSIAERLKGKPKPAPNVSSVMDRIQGTGETSRRKARRKKAGKRR